MTQYTLVHAVQLLTILHGRKIECFNYVRDHQDYITTFGKPVLEKNCHVNGGTGLALSLSPLLS